MFSTKINLLLLPLLFAILLTIASNLRIGKGLNNIFYTVLSPIASPISKLRLFTDNKYSWLINISGLEKQTHEQKLLIARLLTENEYLKQAIIDNKVTNNLKNSFKAILPVRISGSTGKFIVSSSFPLDQVRPGQPLVSGNVLMGTVFEVKGTAVTITPLDSEKSPSFPVRTASGQKGFYKFSDNHAQVTDVPSQYPLVLGDFIFSEPGELFPGNLIIGKTIRITTISQEPLQKADLVLYDTLSNNPENLAIITSP